MEAPITIPGISGTPIAAGEKFASGISQNHIWLTLVSLLGIGFLALYAYKTVLDVRVVKQVLIINEQETTLNKTLIAQQSA